MDRFVDRTEKLISISAGLVTIAGAIGYRAIESGAGVSLGSSEIHTNPIRIESLPLRLILVVVMNLSVAAFASVLLVALSRKLRPLNIILMVLISMVCAWTSLTCNQLIALGPFQPYGRIGLFGESWYAYYFILAAVSVLATVAFVYIRSEPDKYAVTGKYVLDKAVLTA